MVLRRFGLARVITTAALALLALLISLSGAAEEPKYPVFVSQQGTDQVGFLFVSAFRREISRSARYKLMPPGGSTDGFRFSVQLISVDVADAKQQQGKRSVVSVVIYDMGIPNSFPVADTWYHKVIVVDSSSVGKLAKELLDDMDARWCSYIRNAIVGCPKEKFWPKLR